MQLTPNYKLKKPEGTDPIDIQDFNDNADLIDAALKKKAESSGGDISGMTVKTLDDITTEFPVPVAGESTKTFLGKVKKFFSDTKNWMTGVCLIGQIVNNCVTNNAKLPLSAAQGKVLMDLYNVLNTNLTMCFTEAINLCQNASGVITLSDSVYNYKMLQFENSNFGFSSSPIYGTQPIIRAGTVSVSGDAMVLCCGAWTVSNNGKTLTPSYMVQANITASGVTYFNRNAGLTWNIIGYRK